MPDVVPLADLGVDEDPGTSWHPRPDKQGVRDAEGCLVDLDDDQVAEHITKPEALDQPDSPLNGGPFAAEDSTETPRDVV